jgi:hypothetical protein
MLDSVDIKEFDEFATSIGEAADRAHACFVCAAPGRHADSVRAARCQEADMRRAAILPAMLVGFGAAVASADPVDFQIVDQSVHVDKAQKVATFTLTFSAEPDFTAAPQTHAFQYEVDAGWAGKPDGGMGFEHITTVIRGGEIWEGNGLPVRNRDGNGGSVAGGWGPARDFIPFELDGQKLSFTTTLGDIGDADGVFRYRVFTTANGTVTSEANGAVIPLPAAIGTGIMMLGALGAKRKLKRPR